MILMDNINLVPAALWVCSVTGTLFICYAFATFIHRTLENTFRLILSFLFGLTGFLFFSSVGSILSGQAVEFTILSLLIAVMLAMLGLCFVYVIYKQSRTINKNL